MHVALEDLKLECLFVVNPGRASYPMNERTETLPISDLGSRLAQVDGNEP